MIKEKFTAITPLTGLIVVAFVVLVGALGYSYVMSYGAQVARVPADARKIPAQTMSEPTQVRDSHDLATFQNNLADALTDDLSATDLNDIHTSLDSL